MNSPHYEVRPVRCADSGSDGTRYMETCRDGETPEAFGVYLADGRSPPFEHLHDCECSSDAVNFALSHAKQRGASSYELFVFDAHGRLIASCGARLPLAA